MSEVGETVNNLNILA